MTVIRTARPLIAALLLGSATAPALQAQAAPAAAPNSAPKEATGAPSSLVILFASGSSALRPEDKAVLDRASRAYNEGKPIVMVLTGSSDRVGRPQTNLTLSQRRATAVLNGLLDRGIPADRFQVLAKGETEPPVPTEQGVPEAQNRRVEISWR